MNIVFALKYYKVCKMRKNVTEFQKLWIMISVFYIFMLRPESEWPYLMFYCFFVGFFFKVGYTVYLKRG